MAVKGKGKQIATKSQPPSPLPSTSSGKRKKVVADRSRRRKRRIGALQFFDDVAQDADYDDDEEGEEDKEDDDGDYEDEGIDLDFSKGGRSEGKDYKSSGKSHFLPFLVKEEELSGDELEELIRDRYGRGSEYVVYDEDPKEYNDGVSVEHSVEDPNIWRVKCMVGREQQIVLSLMHKFADLQRRETKMDIVSAFTLEHLKGYVYIEADKAFDVVEACKGLFNIYPSKMGLVPQNEIPQLLSIRSKVSEILKGTWVRMKSGNYKGDLGQVVDYDAARRRATIKLVPRINLQAIAKKYGGGISLKEAAVPAPRLISSHELEQFRPHIEIKRDRQSGDLFEVLDGLMLKDGYLYKKVSIASIVYWGVQPSKGELLKFTETSKAEDDDVSWLSSVYNVRKKMKSSQAYDHKGTSEQRNGFNLHDLVLFGRKGFGVIIDMGKDDIKILKGDTEGQEVMTVKTQDIKSGCVDKMFTASDRHRKTISINDVVKVLDGPAEGRQGIVKHMYKGTLFIHDENQEENSGIFCSKSNFCENIAPQKDSSFRKAGNKSSSLFNQSSEQDDGARTFGMNRHSETNQTFSIGQTLRIRKGPLKGYLCRVVGIYRSDVTVKLDSLVKVLTVHEQDLSIPNVRRDASTEMSADIFGAQEKLIGGLSENADQTTCTSSWDVGSSSWQALPTSNFPFSTNTDKKTDQELGADPWGSKVAPVNEQGADPWGSKVSLASNEQAQGTDPWGSNVAGASTDKEQNADPWGSKVASGDSSQSNKQLDSWAKASSASGSQDSSWNKAADGICEKDVGGWNNNTSATARNLPTSDKEQGTDPWGSKVSLAARDQKQGADPWGGKEPLAAEGDHIGADPWGNKVAATARDKDQKDDPWSSKVASRGSSHSNTPLDSWAKASSAGGEQNSSWNKPAGGGFDKDQDDWKKPAKSASAAGSGFAPSEKEQGADPWGSKVSLAAEEDKQGADPWGSKASVAAEDPGGADPLESKLASRAEEKETGADPWGSKAAGASRAGKEERTDPWGSKATWTNSSHSNKSLDSLAKASSTGGDQNSSWNKAAGGSWGKDGDGWNKPSAKSTPSTGGDVASVWETASMGTKSAAEDGGEQSNWDKVKVSSDTPSGWGKADSATKNVMDGWNNPNSFGGDLASIEDTGKFNQKDSWDKPSNFEGGRGFGRGRGRDGNSWGKPMDHGEGQGSDVNSESREDGWSRQRDFDRGRGSNRGRGRGRFGGRGARDEDNQDNQGGYGGGWGSGGGRGGRGRFGGRGFGDEDNQDNQGGYGGGWGSGGRGGRGRFGGRGSGDEDNQDNQGGYGGGWGSGGRGGRGRFGGRGSGDEDNRDNQGGFGGGWGSGRGRGGRGRYGGRGYGDEDNQDSQGSGGSWSSGRGRGGWGRSEDSGNLTDNFGRGRGRGRGRFQSSDWNKDQDNLGDRSFSADPSSSWGNQQSTWNKSKEESGHIEQSDGWDGWSSKHSSHGKKGEGSNKSDAPEKADGDNLPSKWNPGSSTNDVGGGGNWNARSKNEENNWNPLKASSSAGDFASWEKVSAGKEATGVGGGWGSSKQTAGNELSSWAQDKAGARDNNRDSEKPQTAQQSSGWNDARKEWTKSNSYGESGNSDIAREDNWNRAKPGSDEQSVKESNWDCSKSWVSKRPSDWNQSSTASELGKELGSDGGDNWSKPKPFSRGNQSSAWGNNNSSDWSKAKSSSWNDSSSGFKYGDGDQSGEGWNRGSNGGRGDSFSGRGRGFRGRGRNFQGGRSSDWNGDRGTNKEEQSENFSRPKTFGGQSSNWNDEGFTSGNKSDWNAKENAAEKGSWDNWNAKKVSDGKESKSSGWNSPSLAIKEGEQKDGAFSTGSSSKGEQGGGWGSGSFNKQKSASNWNDGGGSSAKNDDDGWGSKSTVQNQPESSGWNNQKQSDDGGDGNWGKAKGDDGGKGW